MSALEQRFAGAVLVTGASGFVGTALLARLAAEGYKAVAAPRRRLGVSEPPESDRYDHVNMSGCYGLVHLAARVHVMHEAALDPLAEYRKDNVEATLRLARRAAAAGIKRFVYLSSIKVNGESTLPGMAFTEADAPRPRGPYAISKYEAELGLMGIAGETGLEVVIVRPPLVYGPGVRANFAALARAVQRRWPLPLGAVHNKRSLVAVDNLADFIVTCLTAPQASNEVFLVSDGEDLSSAELCRGLAYAAGVPPRLIAVPLWLLQGAAALLGARAVVGRLCESLQVDPAKARERLGWVPPLAVQAGLGRVYRGGGALASGAQQ